MQKKYLTSELVRRENRLSFFNYIGILPNPDEILSKTGNSIENYRKLKYDPHVWSCIQSRKSGLQNLEYALLTDDAEPALIKLIEQFISEINLSSLIADIAESVLYGWQPFELIWDETKSGPRYILPTKIQAKPQEWFCYDTKGRLCLKGKYAEAMPVSRFKFATASHEASYANPYGEALLARCYWAVTFKNGGLRFWVNFMEKYGMPILIGKYNRGATKDEAENLAQTLSDMHEDAVIVSPSDIEISLAEATRTSSTDLYLEMINFCNTEISKALLSQTLTTELKTGSLAAAQTHYKIRREIIIADAKIAESFINHIIKLIAEINFGEVKSPQIRLTLNDSDNNQKLERDIRLFNAGVPFNMDYWTRTYGLKKEDLNL
jgi:phage gp29-like protein